MFNKILSAVAILAIVSGLVANEWFLTKFLGWTHFLSPATRVELLFVQILLVSFGIYTFANRRHPIAFFTRRVTILLINVAITFVLLEVVLRLLFSQPLYIRTQAIEFWRHDTELGWSMKPNIEGEFSNGYFRGIFHTDANGNRLNSKTGTFMPDYSNIFMIGDSVTASLEVDDDETIAALLEQRLRSSGHDVNIINLGVRGYGTDQSVRKAMFFADQYKPTDIIYTYVSNDTSDNNRVRQKFFGKGAYYRLEPKSDFTAYNYPVDRFDDHTRSVVLLDEKCSPVVITESGKSPVTIPSKPWYFKLFYSLRAKAKLKNDFNNWWKHNRKVSDHKSDRKQLKNGEIIRSPDLASQIQKKDPFVLLKAGQLTIEDESFWRLRAAALADNGITQIRCRSYFADQLTFLMELLRAIPSVERIHVVVHGLPSASPDSYEPTFSALAFRKMYRDNLIDSVIELPSIQRNRSK